jgi:hypothetical protein
MGQGRHRQPWANSKACGTSGNNVVFSFHMVSLCRIPNEQVANKEYEREWCREQISNHEGHSRQIVDQCP